MRAVEEAAMASGEVTGLELMERAVGLLADHATGFAHSHGDEDHSPSHPRSHGHSHSHRRQFRS